MMPGSLSMKSTTIIIALFLTMGLVAGCGSSNNPGVVVGGDCNVDADCDDGLFCTGTDTCVAGTCVHVAPCDQSNPCAPQKCIETADTCRAECAATGPEDPCCSDPLCADKEVCIDTLTYNVSIEGIAQDPENCFVPQDLLDRWL